MTDKKLGPTGKFPKGKISGGDEGELRLAVTADLDADVVRVSFGVPTTWLGFEPEEAVAFAQAIIEKARAIARKQRKTLTVTL